MLIICNIHFVLLTNDNFTGILNAIQTGMMNNEAYQTGVSCLILNISNASTIHVN